jgi:hypothetical protein
MPRGPAASATTATAASTREASSGVRAIKKKGFREQTVACQNGRGLVELLVARRFAPTQVVVVHGGQVVVDERVRVDALQGAGEVEHIRSRQPFELRPGQHQGRPQTLAAGTKRILHGLAQAPGHCAVCKQRDQPVFHQPRPLPQGILQGSSVHHASS